MRKDVFNAIADPTRRSILLRLTKEAQNINALAEQFNMSRQAVSLHIKYLEDCEVITIQKKGRERYCFIQAQKLREVANWIEHFREMWTDKLQSLDKLLNEIQSKPKQ